MQRRQRARRVPRNISYDHNFVCFKPAWIPRMKLEHVELLKEEYEAMRLVDIEKYSMQEGAKQMGVSAPTFNRMVQSVHQKVADALIHHKWIRVYQKEL